jgi:hypothetical protein
MQKPEETVRQKYLLVLVNEYAYQLNQINLLSWLEQSTLFSK